MRDFETWLFEQHFRQWVAYAFALALSVWPAYKMVQQDLRKLKRS